MSPRSTVEESSQGTEDIAEKAPTVLVEEVRSSLLGFRIPSHFSRFRKMYRHRFCATFRSAFAPRVSSRVPPTPRFSSSSTCWLTRLHLLLDVKLCQHFNSYPNVTITEQFSSSVRFHSLVSPWRNLIYVSVQSSFDCLVLGIPSCVGQPPPDSVVSRYFAYDIILSLIFVYNVLISAE